jgi:hypothetical protein
MIGGIVHQREFGCDHRRQGGHAQPLVRIVGGHLLQRSQL